MIATAPPRANLAPPPAAVAAPLPAREPEAVGEFDPFASGSVRAIVDAVTEPSVITIAPTPKVASTLTASATLAMPPSAFPESGPIETITAQHAAALRSIIGVLDELDYFQVLRLSQDAVPADIKKAFYRESRTYHPDRFFHLPEHEAKSDIGHVYKRITEAYYFLRDDTKRKKYLADISGPDRRGRIRFTEVSEVETKELKKKEQEEQIGTHPKGRAFYTTAMGDFDRSQWASAQRNLKMALTYEPANPRYKEKLAEVQVKLDEMFKQAPDKFKIR